MATGYMTAPISKLPFLNIMTDVLLMQVPDKRPEDKLADVRDSTAAPGQNSEWTYLLERVGIKLMS